MGSAHCGLAAVRVRRVLVWQPSGIELRAPQASADLCDSYLRLLERALTHTLYDPTDVAGPSASRFSGFLRTYLRRSGILLCRPTAHAEQDREEGRDWPLFAQTMVGSKRLAHLRECVETVIDEEIPGDLIETGVWRGGATIMMRGVLHAHGVTDRSVWLADSFTGLPRPRAVHPADAGSRLHAESHLAISRAEVEGHFRRYGLLDEQVRFVEGLFHQTLPTLAGHQWSLLRLDGDLYGSTMDALTNLYDDLAPGGYVIVDDYGAGDTSRKAVEDFRAARAITAPLQPIDWSGVFWRKGRP